MPVIALGFEAAIDLGVLLCFVFLIALSFAYAQTLGLALRAVANALDSVASDIPGFGFLFSTPAGWIHDVDNAIRSALGTGIAACEYAWHKVMQFTASTIGGIGTAMDYVAGETRKGFETLVKYSVPYMIAAALAPVARAAYHAAEHAVVGAKSIPAEITKVYRVTRTYPTTVIYRVPKLARAAVAGAAVAAAAVGTLVYPRLGQLERDYAALRKRLGKLGELAGVGTIVGVGAYALSKLGLGSSNCSNVKKLNKGLCGVNPKWIEDLLLGAVSIFGSLSLIKLAQDYQKLIAGTAGEVVKFWRGDVAGLGIDRLLGTPGGGFGLGKVGSRAVGSPVGE